MSESGRPIRSQSAEAVAPELRRLRDAIDTVDHEILDRLNRRAELVTQVGHLKRDSDSPVYVAGREREIQERLAAANPGPFPSAAISHVFREIVSATRSLEDRVCVAFLGPEGTFSHQAAVRQFGSQIDLLATSSFSEVCALTERGKSHFGVLPVENMIEGAVTQSLDALVESDLTICGELLLDVSQTLMSKSGRLADVRRVASHPQPLAQCRQWLQAHLPGVDQVETTSTARAAELAVREADVAAIGSEVAAESGRLQVIERQIEDRRGNTTRFLVVGREAPRPTGDDLTVAVFTIQKDKSGALYHLLESFAKCEVNLTAIQSRPMKGKPWEYLFFVDMEGHVDDPSVGRALDEAARVAYSHKVLGSFPRAPKKPTPNARRG